MDKMIYKTAKNKRCFLCGTKKDVGVFVLKDKDYHCKVTICPNCLIKSMNEEIK